MSESTEELRTALEGLGQSFAEVSSLAGRLGEHTEELTEEAGAHGWHGIAQRMQEAGEAFSRVLAALSNGQQSCESASAELNLIDDTVPAAEVAGHLGVSSAELATAVTEMEGAIESVEEAQAAVTEVGQEGLMQAALELHDQVSELQQRIVEQQGSLEQARAEADEYAKRTLGN